MRLPVSHRSFLQLALASSLLLLPLALLGRTAVLHQESDRQPVADGVELVRIRQLDSQGWLNLFALEIDHTKPGLTIDALLGNDRLTGAQPLSDTVRARGAVAAINGDFFHIQTTSVPIGGHVQGGELFKSPPAGDRTLIAGFEGEGGLSPVIGSLAFQGRIESSTGAERSLDGWNPPAAPPDSVVYYNHRWAANAPGLESPHMRDWPGLVHAVLDSEHRVIRLLRDRPGPVIPTGGAVLLGRGEGATWLLRNAQPGEKLEIDGAFSPETLFAGIGGFPVLLRDGDILVEPGPGDVHPRTAFGYNRERTRSWFLAVDGRSPLSRGVTLYELATILQSLGADDALNLDGGGTTTLIARLPGQDAPSVQNIPSDGRERSMPNGLGIFNTAPTGTMHQLFIQPPLPPDQFTLKADELRLAPGAKFQPLAFATDRNINPVDLPAPVAWRVSPEHLGTFAQDGTFHAASRGRGQIFATVSNEHGTFEASLFVHVIGEPVLLQSAPSELVLSPGEDIELVVHALDAQGYVAPLSAEDVEWDVLGDVGEVRDGRFFAGDRTGSGALRISFDSVRGLIPVGIGERPEIVASFEDLEPWWTNAVPEGVPSDLSHARHPPFLRERAATAKLKYDFTGTTRTRAAYVRPRGGRLELAGRPLRLGIWVYGDGKEAWLRGHLADAGGITRTIDFARNIDWTGWRYLQTEIPPGLDYPIALTSLYVVETRTDAAYSGAIYVDELHAVYAPEIDPKFLTGETRMYDAANRPSTVDPSDEEHFRFIVFGDSKIVATAPDSAEAGILSSLIEEINRQEVEFVLFTGDLIEHDTADNYRLGKEFLNRLQAPYHMAVANHEIAGTDTYDRYRAHFGETYYNFVRGNSEFIVLNTARPGLRASEPEQWPWLQERLEKSKADNLFIMTHTPVIDPIPGNNTGWSDNSEISLFQRLLTREVEKGRNVYVFHGHVHGFDRRALDGVQYLISAGAGSRLYLPSSKGGFFHYTLVTVKGKEVTYQVVPLLEQIELPEALDIRVGDEIDLGAYGIGPNNSVRFPLRYPAAVEWLPADSGVVSVDPVTGVLQALNAGETTITVRAGGITSTATVSVAK